MSIPTDTRRVWRPHEIDSSAAGTTHLADWLADLGEQRLAALLTEHKALVFRGFGVPADRLDPVLDHLVPGRLAYVHGNSPRTRVRGNLYTSTEYPEQYTISMHNELNYARRWPSRLTFYCEIAAQTGGATPVLDGELWLAALDPAVREAFSGGVRYVQNLHSGYGLGKSWQDTFETDDKAAVEEFLADAEAQWEWSSNGLRVTQVRAATVKHPVTGAEVWFNQADQWHPVGLEDATASSLYSILKPDEFPQYVTFADGSPIPGEFITQIRDRGLENAVDVVWRSGDVLLIDNVLTAHGRRSFTGPRRILVAMS